MRSSADPLTLPKKTSRFSQGRTAAIRDSPAAMVLFSDLGESALLIARFRPHPLAEIMEDYYRKGAWFFGWRIKLVLWRWPRVEYEESAD